ncbi:hypothetical protein [Kangiella sediminilitoris]|uniref:NlpE C-terminal OB domain-containing protein n=1 Tax=Kangiella sediminilitoris TaxID=1144748 RepID=A0A1B3B9K1_9GAMM|nr:hypothetical protein [Kangiella sediminilitoris]AOE49484.1 hypothetical protein KS2013_760 [Kangiella sediminilitoris]
MNNLLFKIIAIIAATLFLLGCSDDPKKPQQAETTETTSEQSQADTVTEQEQVMLQEMIPMEPNEQNIIKGLYSYHNGKTTFIDCSTNTQYTVSQEGLASELRNTYIALREAPQQKVLVEVKGEYDERTSPETDDDIEMLIASELVSVVNKGSCQ